MATIQIDPSFCPGLGGGFSARVGLSIKGPSSICLNSLPQEVCISIDIIVSFFPDYKKVYSELRSEKGRPLAQISSVLGRQVADSLTHRAPAKLRVYSSLESLFRCPPFSAAPSFLDVGRNCIKYARADQFVINWPGSPGMDRTHKSDVVCLST